MKEIHFLLKSFCLLIFLKVCFIEAKSQSVVQTKDSAIKSPKNKGKTLYGQASFYANKFEGKRTASGEIFSHKKLTAACNSLPLGTWIEVTNLRNGKKVVVKTNDRLHPTMRRVVDLTLAAARKLDFISSGLTRVKVVVLNKHKK